MVHKHSTIVEAYSVLGLAQDSELEVVKNTYKQLALKTHPDKNPGNEDATAEFQRLSEAYNVLVKHLDNSSRHQRHASPWSYGSYDDYEDDNYEDFDEDFDDDDEYDSEYEDGLDFYMFLFEQLFNGRASRYSNQRYHNHHHQNHHRRSPTPETPEQYQARVRRMREEQEEAEVRRAREEASRRKALEKERERERKEAEERQRQKAFNKKAQAAACQKAAGQKVREQKEYLQTLRSETFAAARRGDAERVKKGVWEDNVDAAGGEIWKGSEGLVQQPLPQDCSETLMHIAAKNGDLDLVEWLDAHSADPEERNCGGLTPFHVALQRGHVAIVNYFFTNYPPQDSDYQNIYDRPQSTSLLRLALDSQEPELVWTVLDKRLVGEEEMIEGWNFVISDAGKTGLKLAPGGGNNGKYEEIYNLLMTFGGFRPPEESCSRRQEQTGPSNDRSTASEHRTSRASSGVPSPSAAGQAQGSNHSFLGEDVPKETSQRIPRSQRYYRRPYKQQHPPRQSATSSSADSRDSSLPNHPPRPPPHGTHSPRPPPNGRGRGRGRGTGTGRGRGRGRGQPSA